MGRCFLDLQYEYDTGLFNVSETLKFAYALQVIGTKNDDEITSCNSVFHTL